MTDKRREEKKEERRRKRGEEKRREETRREKKQDSRRDKKGKIKEKMQRDKDERKKFFFVKNVLRPSNPPGEVAQNVSKKSLSDELFLNFSSKVQNLTVFSIMYMIRIRFFGPSELIQKYFRAARYWSLSRCVTTATTSIVSELSVAFASRCVAWRVCHQ